MTGLGAGLMVEADNKFNRNNGLWHYRIIEWE
jgi:hypothetical protein